MLVHVPCLDALLEEHGHRLGHDVAAYRARSYRVINYYVAALGDGQALTLLEPGVLAAFHHDLAYWAPQPDDADAWSARRLQAALQQPAYAQWQPLVHAMLEGRRGDDTPDRGPVEAFRRARWSVLLPCWLALVVPVPTLPASTRADVLAVFPSCALDRRLLHWRLRRALSAAFTRMLPRRGTGT